MTDNSPYKNKNYVKNPTPSYVWMITKWICLLPTASFIEAFLFELKGGESMLIQDKRTVANVIQSKGYWTGFLMVNMVNSTQCNGLWCYGRRVTIPSLEELEEVVKKYVTDINGNGLRKQVHFYQLQNNRLVNERRVRSV